MDDIGDRKEFKGASKFNCDTTRKKFLPQYRLRTLQKEYICMLFKKEVQCNAVYSGIFFPAVRISALLKNDSAQTVTLLAEENKLSSEHIIMPENININLKFQIFSFKLHEVKKI